MVTNVTYAHMHIISRWNAIFVAAAFAWPGHENIYCNCTNLQGYHQVCEICGHKCTNYCMTRNKALTVKVYEKLKKKKKIHKFLCVCPELQIQCHNLLQGSYTSGKCKRNLFFSKSGNCQEIL